MRLLILAALVYLAWRALKSRVADDAAGRRSAGDLQSDFSFLRQSRTT